MIPIMLVGQVLPKPRLGQSCNGCGMCCAAEPCHLAVEFLDCTVGPCVALETDGARTYCGLVRRPTHYLVGKSAPPAVTGPLSVHLAYMLGLGVGCDASDEPFEGKAL
jgi:hypothetical protein